MYINEISEAELAICENADSFLQSAMWGEFKSRFGWIAKGFLFEWPQTGEKTPLLLLCRRLAPGVSFAYVPWGPQLPPDFPQGGKAQALAEIAEKLKPFLARNTMFIRFEPPWYTAHSENAKNSQANAQGGEKLAPKEVNVQGGANVQPDENKSLLNAGFKRAAATVQPPDTVIINLSAPCDEILASMKPKWRYNVSLALKKGVDVKTGDAAELETFYSLLKETAERDGISVHSFEYYKTLFEICEQRKKNGIANGDSNSNLSAHIYTASHEGETLAAIFVLFRAKTATYLYGASSNIKRNLMAPYALQWKAMQDAKEAGCQFYDLFGIPPNDDPGHPMAGLYRFKTGFGGRIIHRPGTWDFPYKPVVYALFNFAEALRKKLMNFKKKKALAN